MDLVRLDYLDSVEIRKDSMISNYIKLDSLRVDRINQYDLQVDELTKDRNKAKKRLKGARKLSFGLALGVLIEAFILVLK